MAIASTDIRYYYTTTAGAAGFTTTSTGDQSLGKYLSSSTMNTSIHGLFDVVTGSENAASTVDYRCVAVLNKHASLTLQSPVVWINSETAGGTSVALAVDDTAASTKGNASAQARNIANETTAPAVITFSSTCTTKAKGLALGDIAPQFVKMFWVRRTAANTTAMNDGATFRVEGDTDA